MASITHRIILRIKKKKLPVKFQAHTNKGKEEKKKHEFQSCSFVQNMGEGPSLSWEGQPFKVAWKENRCPLRPHMTVINVKMINFNKLDSFSHQQKCWYILYMGEHVLKQTTAEANFINEISYWEVILITILYHSIRKSVKNWKQAN